MSSFRNFLLTFCISFLLFGIAAVFAVRVVNDTFGSGSKQKKDETAGSAVVVNEEELNSSQSFTMLLVGLDQTKDNPNAKVSADSLLVVRFFVEGGVVVFIPIPSNTQVENGASTIDRAYMEKGVGELCEMVAGLTGFKMDYYAVINIDDFKNAIDKLGGIEYSLTEDLYYEDPDQDLVIDIKKGYQTYDGNDISKILRYRGDDPEVRVKRCLDIADALFMKFANDVYYDEAISMFNDLYTEADTNLTEEEFRKHMDVIFSYQTMLHYHPIYPGEEETTSDGSTVFVPDKNTAYKLFDEYKIVTKTN